MPSMTPPRLAPLASDDARARDPQLEALVQFAGYRPNALLTMARVPGLLPAVMGMVRATVQATGAIEPALRFLIACEVSRGAGCRYSMVHAAHAAHRVGVDWAKLAALPAWRQSPLYTPRECSALAIAAAGATLPAQAPADAAFAEARHHFDEDALLEVVSIVAMFGWFNRWNSLLQSQMEEEPAQISEHLPWLDAPKGATTR
jgi:alkylhydroperoxidase family enzyme